MTGRPRRLPAAVLAVLAALLVLVPGGHEASASGQAPSGGAPVVVVTAPALRWVDLEQQDLPNMQEFLAGSDVAMVSLRTIGARTSLGEGYATIGAGNRASAGSVEGGLALERYERFESGSAATAYERRTLTEPTGELLHLAFPSIDKLNNRFHYGAEPGALGQALVDAGLVPAVIANADLGLAPPADVPEQEAPPADEPAGQDDEPEEEVVVPDEPEAEVPPEAETPVDSDDEPVPATDIGDADHGRSAALAAMDRGGQVARGRASGLLDVDAMAPYGVRLDPAAVVSAIRSTSTDADVTFVELSDLERADSFRRVATSDAGSAVWDAALRASDALFGEVLEVVPDDAVVMLLTPAPPRAAETLGVFGLRSAGGSSGLARSGATRRPGYVTLADIAPTILDHFDVDEPDSMTGTLITRDRQAEVDDERIEALASSTAEAVFRLDVTGPVSVVFVVAQIIAYALAAVAVSRRQRWTRPVSYLALTILATPSVAFLVGLLHLESGAVPLYVLGIFAAAVVLAAAAEAVAMLIARRWPRTRALVAPLLLVSLTWTVLIVDIVTGGRLQIDTVFGYSPIVAGRFAGFGNLAFALVAIGAVVVACGAWAVHRLARGPADGSAVARGAAVVALVVFLGFTVIVDGAPAWGADVGGVLASVPAFAVLVLVAVGARISWPRAALIGLATVVVLSVFAAIDLARPEEDRTHLGRLVARLGGDGSGGFFDILQRKISANISILFSSVWTLTIPFALGLMVFLARRSSGFLRDLQEQVPGIRAMLAGGLLVAFLGFALNDSGVAVPAMMFAVLLPFLTYVLLRWDPDPR